MDIFFGPLKKRRLQIKNNLRAVTLVSLSSLCGLGVVNAVAATATLSILAKLVKAIDITVNASMDFGTLAMTTEKAGSATIDPNVDKLFVDTKSTLALAGGKPTAGQVRVKGFNSPVTVSVEDTLVKLTNGSSVLSVSNFKFANGTLNNIITVTPEADNGIATIAVGATIKTKPGQLTGNYIGANRIFANYQ